MCKGLVITTLGFDNTYKRFIANIVCWTIDEFYKNDCVAFRRIGLFDKILLFQVKKFFKD
jgi:hypothetical protein